MPAGGRAEGVSHKTWVRILGVGQFTVSGNNMYTGATAVNAGKMLINGQLGHTAIAVNASGLLGGSGTILGDVTVGSSGTSAPGNSPGALDGGIALAVGRLDHAHGDHRHGGESL